MAHSRFNQFVFTVPAFILLQLTSLLPTSPVALHSWKMQHKLPLADSTFDQPGAQIINKTVVKEIQQWDLIKRYSKLNKLLRITCYVIKAVNKFEKRPQDNQSLNLTPDELAAAKLFWIKDTQQNYFANELQWLQQNKLLSKSNSLIKLTPFVDIQGMLRVGGHFKHSSLSTEEIYQLILSERSTLTELLLQYIHEELLHAGAQLMLPTIRRNYWIVVLLHIYLFVNSAEAKLVLYYAIGLCI